MKHPTTRTTLLAAGAAALIATFGPASAQPADIRGAGTFEGGAAIPEGQLEIYLDDPAIDDSAESRAAATHIESDGKAKAIDFSLPPAAIATASPTLQIVARLERADGWLLAR